MLLEFIPFCLESLIGVVLNAKKGYLSREMDLLFFGFFFFSQMENRLSIEPSA